MNNNVSLLEILKGVNEKLRDATSSSRRALTLAELSEATAAFELMLRGTVQLGGRLQGHMTHLRDSTEFSDSEGADPLDTIGEYKKLIGQVSKQIWSLPFVVEDARAQLDRLTPVGPRDDGWGDEPLL